MNFKVSVQALDKLLFSLFHLLCHITRRIYFVMCQPVLFLELSEFNL